MVEAGPRLLGDLAVPAAGCTLATDVYLPAGRTDLRRPAVLLRTPYGRTAHVAEGMGWAERGHAFVVQDVRGRYGSSGTWRPWQDELTDAAAVTGWLAAQPWSDGRFVATGASYAAHAAWACAAAAPAACLGVLSMVAALGPAQVKLDPSGVLRLAEHVTWWLEHGEGRESRPGLAAAAHRVGPGLLDQLPVSALGRATPSPLPGLVDVLDRLCPPDGAPAPDVLGLDELARTAVPSMHVGGWSDLLVGDTFAQFAAAGQRCAPRPARHLVVGPWGHDLGGPGAVVGTPGRPLGALVVGWVEARLRDVPDGRPTVQVWDEGAEAWWQGDRWPGAVAVVSLPSTGEALRWPGPEPAPEPGPHAGAAAVLGLVHDPAHPHPHTPLGHDAPPSTARPDVVRLDPAPVPGPVRVQGEPVAAVRVRSDRAGADVVVRLLHHRGGRRRVAARGMTSRRWRPGTWLDVEVPLGPVLLTLRPGDAVGLEVAAADHPHVARDLGTDEDRYRSTATRPVRVEVATGPGATRLHLPLVTDSPTEAPA